MDTGWIGVDFDGTLAHGETEEPVPAMVERVKNWLSKGIEVRIVTARVGPTESNPEAQRLVVSNWCIGHIGRELRVVACKDYQMFELWDDRAVAVEKNTGRVLGGPSRGFYGE